VLLSAARNMALSSPQVRTQGERAIARVKRKEAITMESQEVYQ
jgi:hypothetical protein